MVRERSLGVFFPCFRDRSHRVNPPGERKVTSMNSLIKLKTTPPLLITVALVCFGLLPGAQAAQVGDSVFAFVGVENRVELVVSNDP